MLKNKALSSRITYAAVGGVLGFLISAVAVNEPVLFAIPGLRIILAASPFPVIITTTVLGIAVGGFTGALSLYFQKSGAGQNTDDKIKIKLREEQLDITKDRVKTSDVYVRKEIITDEKTITIPVKREELVVEKKAIGNNQDSETVRIPLSEEHIKVIKHPKILKNVTLSKKEYAETEAVEEILKKERLTIDSKGDIKTGEK